MEERTPEWREQAMMPVSSAAVAGVLSSGDQRLAADVLSIYARRLLQLRPTSSLAAAMLTTPKSRAIAKLNENIKKMFRGKRVFIVGVADDNGYSWPIVKVVAVAGSEIPVGTWVPIR
ncbi:hypothetical protein GUJ93_ZPchr0012g21936 [Zizania palustris]|uniref:Uncharacterized protein n=1 Tax=Zizania palustris TaxID=103762 RepID=A0A8J5WUJ2_ZIZPA|nr:hypothetical protein GUJ93_ZPchr0012g21936 [Zizania palustris]